MLVDAIHYRYGYDFSGYSYSSQKRCLKKILEEYNYNFFSELQNLILYDQSVFNEILPKMTITVSEFFRDPEFYRALREDIVAELRTYPKIKVWHAGCANGEEVYSLAVLLQEEALYEKSYIYATDINPKALEHAKKGVYKADALDDAEKQYLASGAKSLFSDYYERKDSNIIMDDSLKKNIVFADHNLVTDSKFAEMNLILCRNVLIYFNKDLKNRALNLMHDSLLPGGFFALGSKESISLSSVEKCFKKLRKKEKIYQKKWL